MKHKKNIISWGSLNLFTSNRFVIRKLNGYYLNLFLLFSVLKSGSLLLGMWPGDDIDPLSSQSHDIEDRESVLLQVQYSRKFSRGSIFADRPSLPFHRFNFR